MKKTTIVKILVLLALSLLLIGCNKNEKDTSNDEPVNEETEEVVETEEEKEEEKEEKKDEFKLTDDLASYFEKTKEDESVIEGTYDISDDGDVYFYVDNYSEDKFALLDLTVEEIDSDRVIYESTDIFIRPGYLYVDLIETTPGFYYTDNLEFFTLKGATDIDYKYFYGYDEDGGYVTHLSRSGGFSDEEAEGVAINEYIIAVMTGMIEYEYYFFDLEMDDEVGNEQFLELEPMYKTEVDYDNQIIELYKVDNGELVELKTIDMPFGY